MFWKSGKALSMTNRLLLIFVASTVLMLSIITALIYPPMRDLLNQSHFNHEHHSYLLTQICVKKFFMALWLSSGVIVVAAYVLAQKSLSPLKKFTNDLASISVSSLGKRLDEQGMPKELSELALACNELLLRIELGFSRMKQFSASMAHELRTPIHYLQTATEISLAKPQTVEAYHQLLQGHLEDYQVLTQLIDNLLFLARSEQGQLVLKRKKIAASRLILEVVEYYRSLAEEKSISLEVCGDADLDVDKHLFKRVIANLIDNSLTYTLKGGRVRINTHVSSDNKVCIMIQDNGIGIAKQHLKRVCEGFYRVNHDSNSDHGGLGLGLAIAQAIMEHHQGQLTLNSELGVGTTVTLSLA